jgi:uncharacterized protein
MALALAAPVVGAVPPPLPQTGANCERPTYASDRVVCGDAALLELDRRVSEAWRVIVARQSATQTATQPAAQTATDLPPLLEAQEAWFGRRSRCAFVEAHAACLQAAYRDRARVLDAWQQAVSGAMGGPGVRMRCTGAPWGDAAVTVHRLTQALVVSRIDGPALAVATPGNAQEGWRPYVKLDGAALPIRLWPLTGTVIVCSPA